RSLCALPSHPPPPPPLFPYTTLFRSLHPRPPRVRIERDDAVHVLGIIDDDCDVATLAGEAGAAAASDDRRTVTAADAHGRDDVIDRKSTRLNSSHEWISYAVFCLKKK